MVRGQNCCLFQRFEEFYLQCEVEHYYRKAQIPLVSFAHNLFLMAHLSFSRVSIPIGSPLRKSINKDPFCVPKNSDYTFSDKYSCLNFYGFDWSLDSRFVQDYKFPSPLPI